MNRMSGKSNRPFGLFPEERFAKEIVSAMCEHDLMNGWFGDVSPEFQRQQVEWLNAMTLQEWRVWLDRNRYNLVNRAGLPWAANL